MNAPEPITTPRPEGQGAALPFMGEIREALDRVPFDASALRPLVREMLRELEPKFATPIDFDIAKDCLVEAFKNLESKRDELDPEVSPKELSHLGRMLLEINAVLSRREGQPPMERFIDHYHFVDLVKHDPGLQQNPQIRELLAKRLNEAAQIGIELKNNPKFPAPGFPAHHLTTFYSRLEKICRAHGEFKAAQEEELKRLLELADELRLLLLERNHPPSLLKALNEALSRQPPGLILAPQYCAQLAEASRIPAKAPPAARNKAKGWLLEALEILTKNRHKFGVGRNGSNAPTFEAAHRLISDCLKWLERDQLRPGIIESVRHDPAMGGYSGIIQASDGPEDDPERIVFDSKSFEYPRAHPQKNDQVLFLCKKEPGEELPYAYRLRHAVVELPGVTGLVRMLQTDRGFGVIQTDDGRDAFFHFNSLPDPTRPPALFSRVRCELWTNPRGLNARNIEPVGPETGRITSFGNLGYGFIESDKQEVFFFRLENVADNKLRSQLEKPNPFFREDVTFIPLESPGHKYNLATEIAANSSALRRLSRALWLEKNKHFEEALRLAKEALAADPTNGDFAALRDRLQNRTAIAAPKGNDLFSRARRAWILEQDLEKAERLYREAIQKHSNHDNAIKDLSSLLRQAGRPDEGIQLLEQAISRPGSHSIFASALTTAYEHAKLYQKAAAMLQAEIKLQNSSQSGGDPTLANARLAILLRRLGYAHFRLENYSEAEKVLQEALRLRPNYQPASQLLDKVQAGRAGQTDRPFGPNTEDNGESDYELDSSVEDTFITLSPLAEAAIKNCSPAGIDPAKFHAGEVSLADAEAIAKSAAENSNCLGRERAQYYLTAAAIAYKSQERADNSRDLSIDEHSASKEVDALFEFLALYFFNFVMSPLHREVRRTYFAEVFACYPKERWGYLTSYLRTFLHTNSNRHSPPGLKRDYFKIASDLFVNCAKNSSRFALLMQGVLFLSLSGYRALEMAREIIAKDRNLIAALSHYLKKPPATGLENLWDAFIQERVKLVNARQEIRDCCNTLRTAKLATSRLEDLLIQLESLRGSLYGELDPLRLGMLQEIAKKALAFCKADDWQGKAFFAQAVGTATADFVRQVGNDPTHISFENFIPVAQHLNSLVEREFATVTRERMPELMIELTANSYVPNANSEIDLLLNLSNPSSWSAPASNIELLVESSEGGYYESSPEFKKVLDTLRGGEKKETKISISVSPRAHQERVFPIGFHLRYTDYWGQSIHIPQPTRMSVELQAPAEWREIENPYAHYISGSPVPPSDKQMFVGRDVLIEKIANELLSARTTKTIFLHGQKRSGKTSLKDHLFMRLSGEPGCVTLDFSIHLCQGENGKLRGPKILYVLLTALQEELADKMSAFPSLLIDLPSRAEFEESPSHYFHHCLSSFRKACSRTAGCEQLRLVVLIDEFTDLFWAINNGEVPREFMRLWKSVIEKRYFSCVLIGKDVAAQFRHQFANEFAVTEDLRVPYLTEAATRELIEKVGADHYAGKAIGRIYELTLGNPFLTMVFCSHLVDYMNDPKTRRNKVTEADVDLVCAQLVECRGAVQKENFEAFYDPAEGKIETGFDKQEYYVVLLEIARKSEQDGWCSHSALKLTAQKAQVVEDLLLRQVIETKKNAYRIVVALFREWLKRRPPSNS